MYKKGNLVTLKNHPHMPKLTLKVRVRGIRQIYGYTHIVGVIEDVANAGIVSDAYHTGKEITIQPDLFKTKEVQKS